MRKALLVLLLLSAPAWAQRVDTSGREVVNVETGSVTCSQSTAANLKVDLSGTAANSTAVKVDGSAVTQPVSGTVTCNAGSGTLAVSATNLDVQIGGSDTVAVDTTSADQITPLGAAADGAAVSGNPLRVAGKDGSGNTQDILTDTGGAVQVDVESMPTTTVTATNLDVQIGGSDTVTVSATNLDVQIGGSDSLTIGTLPNEGQQTAANSISITPDTDNDSIGATGSAVPGEATLIGGTDGTNVTVPYIDPCQREAKTYFPVNISTATTTEIANQVASEFFYICSINLITAGANNVAIVEDDSDTCASPTAGLNGGTTAGSGWNIAANGGIALGDGLGSVMKTGTANRYFCIITSASVQLSGTVVYVSAP